MQGLGAAGKVGGKIEGGGGGEGDRARRRASPRRARPVLAAALPRPTSELGSRIFVAISGSGRGQRSRMAMARSNSQRARISASAAGASGKTENTRAAALARCRDRIALPCASLQAGCEAVRVRRSQVEPRRHGGETVGSKLGGRPARSRHSRSSFAAGPSVVANGEAQVAQRAFVGVEAQDLGGGGGALEREAGAQRPGGGRVAAQEGVEEREAGAGGEQGIALPCPSARPRPGRDRRRRRKGLPFQGFRRVRRVLARASWSGAATPSPRSAGGSTSRSGSARITCAW